MPRWFELLLAVAALAVFALPMLLVALAVKLTSRGPILYWSDRVGWNNSIYRMPKFRSMRVGTPALATHLLVDGQNHLTPIGGFLRKTSLDELPQLWCLLTGEMAIVGPRPALFNQDDLVGLRTEKGIHLLRPGITGWAQINGRDQLTIPDKVALDQVYLRRRSFVFDLKVIALTAWKVVAGRGVSH
jgi:O-antigen biosynthesis protein WbqP